MRWRVPLRHWTMNKVKRDYEWFWNQTTVFNKVQLVNKSKVLFWIIYQETGHKNSTRQEQLAAMEDTSVGHRIYESGRVTSPFSCITKVLSPLLINSIFAMESSAGAQSFYWFCRAEELSGAVVSKLDYCAGDPGSIPAVVEFPTGI